MNQLERDAIFEEVFEDMRNLTTAKGHDYSGDDDVLENFKRNAERLGLEKYQVWSVYFNKHIDAINQAIKDNPSYPKDSSEPFEMRAKDAMVYLALLIALRREDDDARDSQVGAMSQAP